MYLPDFMLKELCEKHNLVSPFDPSKINPASIDLTLGNDFVNLSDSISYYVDLNHIYREAKPNDRFSALKVILEKGQALLACTAERVKIPDNLFTAGYERAFLIDGCCAELRLKSSAARNGLDHALAGWIDPGFEGNLTLELHSHREIEIVASKSYVQLVVAAMVTSPDKSYQQTGRYVGKDAEGAILAKN